MSKKIVCVRDAKTEVFGSVTLVVNLAEAERMFGDLVGDVNGLVGKHPEDFSLHCIGEYDELTGCIIPCDPFCVVRGADKGGNHGI